MSTARFMMIPSAPTPVAPFSHAVEVARFAETTPRASCPGGSVLRLKSAALMQLDHVAIGIAHEDRLRPGPEANGTATQRYPGSL